MSEVSLELLGQLVMQLVDGQRRMEARLAAIDARLEKLTDEVTVLSGIVLRLEGRDVETRGLLDLVRRLERRVAALEART
jgi:hypothetical protein